MVNEPKLNVAASQGQGFGKVRSEVGVGVEELSELNSMIDERLGANRLKVAKGKAYERLI